MTPALAKTTRVRRALLTWAAAGAFVFIAGCASVSAQSAWPEETTGAIQPPAQSMAKLLAQPSPMGDKMLGKPDAAVTIVEYASLGCAICRAFHKVTFPRFKREYIDTGKVHFIYREFPIGKSSTAAAAAARCVPAKDFFRINDKFMNSTGQWNGREVKPDALYKVVQETGLSRATFDTCLSNQKINDGVAWTKQRGRELGVQGTPTFFINGKKVRGGVSIEEMRKLIDEHLHSRTAKPA